MSMSEPEEEIPGVALPGAPLVSDAPSSEPAATPVSVGKDKWVRDDYPPDPFEEPWDPVVMGSMQAEYQRMLDDADKQDETDLATVANMSPEQQEYLASYAPEGVDIDSMVDQPEDFRFIPVDASAFESSPSDPFVE